MLRTRLERMRGLAVGAGLSMLLALTGCGAFFQCEGKTSCGTSSSGGSGGTGTGSYVYVTNSSTSLDAVSVYSIGSGTLSPITGSPFALNFQPTSIAISNNKFLYMASEATSTPGVYMFSLGSSGAPSVLNSGTPLSDASQIFALAASPDGNWLFAIELQVGGYVIQPYSIDTSSGLLTLTTPAAGLPAGASCSVTTSTCSVAVSPSKEFVIATAGGGGSIIYPYSPNAGSAGGITSITNPQSLSAPSSTNGDVSVAVDSANYAYISNTSSIESFSINSSGAVTSSNSLTNTTMTGKFPHAITVSNGFVYTADSDTSNISAFSASLGALTSLGTDVQGPSSVWSIGVDSTGKYLLASGVSASSGVQMFSIESDGTLSNLTQNFPTNTTSIYPVVLAVTH